MTENISYTPTEAEAGVRLSFHENFDALSGFDEFAIEKAFGGEIYDLSFIKQNRAFVFTALRKHRGLDDKAAKQAVMEMSQSQIVEWFTDNDDEDVTPVDGSPAGSTHAAVTATIDPGSEAGKDEPAPA